MSPLRVPITRPSSGVKPMDVSMLSPPWMAVSETPLPKCATTALNSASGV